MKVLVGISGGPRSMVTAWLLKKQGMQVRGVHFDLFSNETSRSGIHEIEKRLGIQIQVMDLSSSAGTLFLRERESSLMAGVSFSAKQVFHRKILFPELLRLCAHSGLEKIATGHMVGLQDDPALQMVRVILGSRTSLDPIFEVAEMNQDSLSRLIAPVGAIPSGLLQKLTGEVSPDFLTTPFELDWKGLESRFESPAQGAEALDLQVFTTAGVLLGRAPLRSLKMGQPYVDSEDPDKQYRIIDLQPRSERAWVQETSLIAFQEFHFDEAHWFTTPGLGMGFCDVGMISNRVETPRMIRLIEFEGGKLKGILAEPMRGEDARILKGDSVLFVNGSEVLGGARVQRVR